MSRLLLLSTLLVLTYPAIDPQKENFEVYPFFFLLALTLTSTPLVYRTSPLYFLNNSGYLRGKIDVALI
jgi:hypothetical protein